MDCFVEDDEVLDFLIRVDLKRRSFFLENSFGIKFCLQRNAIFAGDWKKFVF